ncbi:hypothetical protein HDU97_002665 [Phlyctochytrium planicorne]|nr:hypothetical protein HDU97_002665 [Phlyctochytrium planicorne]
MPMAGCCEQAKWKREEIPDHKFDCIDIDELIDESFPFKLKYAFLFILTVKWLLIYVVDVLIMVFLFATNSFSETKKCHGNSAAQSGSIGSSLLANGTEAVYGILNAANTMMGDGGPGGMNDNLNARLTCAQSQDTERILPSTIRPFIILITILISLILLFIDCRNALTVIRSRDISYAYTTPVAYRYYSLTSYPHFCLFNRIQNSRKTVDVMAFFVFFQFKGWKRLILAEFPRQLIFSLNIRDVVNSLSKNPNVILQIMDAYKMIARNKPTIELMAFSLSAISVGVWVVSFISLVIAFVMFIPLLCTMRGNLKEYVCHKIDKRIGDILRRQSKKRTEAARKAELKEYERKRLALANGLRDPDVESELGSAAPPLGMTQRPTLPDIDVDLDVPLSPASTAHSKASGGSHGFDSFGRLGPHGFHTGFGSGTAYYGTHPPPPIPPFGNQMYPIGAYRAPRTISDTSSDLSFGAVSTGANSIPRSLRASPHPSLARDAAAAMANLPPVTTTTPITPTMPPANMMISGRTTPPPPLGIPNLPHVLADRLGNPPNMINYPVPTSAPGPLGFGGIVTQFELPTTQHMQRQHSAPSQAGNLFYQHHPMHAFNHALTGNPGFYQTPISYYQGHVNAATTTSASLLDPIGTTSSRSRDRPPSPASNVSNVSSGTQDRSLGRSAGGGLQDRSLGRLAGVHHQAPYLIQQYPPPPLSFYNQQQQQHYEESEGGLMLFAPSSPPVVPGASAPANPPGVNSVNSTSSSSQRLVEDTGVGGWGVSAWKGRGPPVAGGFQTSNPPPVAQGVVTTVVGEKASLASTVSSQSSKSLKSR